MFSNSIWYDTEHPYHLLRRTNSYPTGSVEEPREGEIWWVKMPGAVALTEVLVEQITQNTVLLKHPGYHTTSSRYRKCEVDFVEKKTQ